MVKTDRENYEKYWDDISPFIKFGCLKDEKFGEKMKNSMLYKNLDHKYMTLEDIIKEAKGEEADAAKTEEAKAEETKTDAEESKDADAKEEEKTRIFYVTDEVQQSQYINMFKAQGQDAIILTHNIDATFSSLSFSTLTSSFSLPSSLRKISTRLSVVFWNSSFSSSATSSFRESCTSASILKN